mmetsp:Transcript_28100/g.45208  ORF Transcript_28100/g.45208 Transcript_28100/m.45208 type:complete len:235 (+) Transcript_28100:800-1504(+)
MIQLLFEIFDIFFIVCFITERLRREATRRSTFCYKTVACTLRILFYDWYKAPSVFVLGKYTTNRNFACVQLLELDTKSTDWSVAFRGTVIIPITSILNRLSLASVFQHITCQIFLILPIIHLSDDKIVQVILSHVHVLMLRGYAVFSSCLLTPSSVWVLTASARYWKSRVLMLTTLVVIASLPIITPLLCIGINSSLVVAFTLFVLVLYILIHLDSTSKLNLSFRFDFTELVIT